MTKKLATIPEGSLLRIAALKGIATLSALNDKTRVDRKTLRAINTGQPVKETTLQAIADKLRVPLDHLLGPSTLDEVENSSNVAPDHPVRDGFHFREFKLQQLDAEALRQLAGETDQITWLLKINQMSESLEATLLKLRESLRGWYLHLVEIEFGHKDSLDQQIALIKSSADIEASVEQLAKQNLKIYGFTCVRWDKERVRHRNYRLPILRYTSRTETLLSIAPKEKNNSTMRVATGWEPPQKFIASELAHTDAVEVDYRRVWSRDKSDENSGSR